MASILAVAPIEDSYFHPSIHEVLHIRATRPLDGLCVSPYSCVK